MKMYQKGSAAVIALLGVLGVIALVIAVGVMSYISNANYGNEAENGIKSTWENNENILAQNTQKVLEAAQVTEMATADIIKISRGAIEGRYGADGSKAVFQAIREQNPNIDMSLYKKVQQLVEAGRDEFKLNQTTLIDKKNQYKNNLGYVYRGFWLRLAGYPKIDLDKYKAITTEYASETFKTGKEKGPLQLRPSAN